MKYIKKFNQHSLYEAYIVGTEFVKPNLSLCIEEGEVHYTQYIPTPKFLDILYSDSNGNLSYTSTVLSASDGKTPIAICIAGTEFFGENEKARWMSLKYMNYETPDTGSLLTQNMYWGNFGTDITTIDNIIITYLNGPESGYMNVDYYNNSSQSDKLPNIFNENNEWNLSVLGTINQYAMTDIDGKNKTTNIFEYAHRQQNWQTDEYIDNNTNNSSAPAACCCWRYHTLGTQQGDWYLGAAGEMCMILAKKIDINTKLALISAVYPNDCISSLADDKYWTCTEYGGQHVYSINTDTAWLGISYYSKSTYGNFNTIALLQY